MATCFFLRRLPLSHILTISRPSTTKVAAFSYFYRRNFSSPVKPLSPRSSPNDGEVWFSELGGPDFGSAKVDEGDWRVQESEILKDIERTVMLAKEILHSGRYNCGDTLSADDEKEVVERLLSYHPHREDKIGCGMESIMVDKHPLYRRSRCLFVVRVDGSMEDFSYRKCLASYVKHKYPSDAERFLSLHLTKPAKAY